MAVTNWKDYIKNPIQVGMIAKVNPESDKTDWFLQPLLYEGREFTILEINKVKDEIKLGIYSSYSTAPHTFWSATRDFFLEHFIIQR